MVFSFITTFLHDSFILKIVQIFYKESKNGFIPVFF